MADGDRWVVVPAGQRADGGWIDDTLAQRQAELALRPRAPQAGRFPRQRVELFRGPNADDDAQELFAQRGWTDGLPIVVPTVRKVELAVQASGLPAQRLIGTVDPLGGQGTVEKIAVQAVMAGCRADLLPVVVAAVDAVCDPAFNLRGVQTTDENVTPLVIVSGPVVKDLGFNAAHGLLGPGWRANATVGRALRLVLQNLGGGWPGIVSFAGAGQPGRYTLCLAEDDSLSPWQPLREELGWARHDSVVIVTRAESAVNVTGGLPEIASAMGSATSLFSVIHGGVATVLLGPHTARGLARSGLTRADVQRRLWQDGRLPVHTWDRSWLRTQSSGLTGAAAQARSAGEPLPVVETPQDLVVLVGGGDLPLPQHVWFPTWGFPPARIVREIR